MDSESDRSPADSFVAAVREAMRYFHTDASLNGLSLRDLFQVRRLLREQPALKVPQALRMVLLAGIARLEERDADAAALLRWRFVATDPTERVGRAGRYAGRGLAASQSRALEMLANEVWTAEQEAIAGATLSAVQQRALAGLPSRTYTRLFGVNQHLSRLKDFLRDPGRFWLVTLDGMAGAGKTALARAAAEDLVREGRFERVVWIMARRLSVARGRMPDGTTPALTYPVLLDEIAGVLQLEAHSELEETEREAVVRAALSQPATLVVVDNLETAVDIEALLADLARLARPTKVLATSRVRVRRLGPAVSMSVHKLERGDALDLIEHWARARNTLAWLHAGQDAWQRLAELTDGNPLAIKVALALTRSRPSEVVLHDLALAQTTAAGLYEHLLRLAWQRLSEPARHLLLHLPLFDARGASLRHIAAIAGPISQGDWQAAVTELTAACLLDGGYVGSQFVYSTHRLTEHFVVAEAGQSEQFAAAVERATRHWFEVWSVNPRDRAVLQETRAHATRALLWCVELRCCSDLAADLASAMQAQINYLGGWDEWEPCLRRVVDELGPLVDAGRQLTLRGDLAVLCFRRHRLDDALALLEENVRSAQARGDRRQLATAHLSLAETYLNAVDLQRAEAEAQGVLALAEESGDVVVRADGLIDLARVRLEQARPAEAEGYLREALGLMQAADNAPYEAKACLFLGHAAGALDAWEDALAWFRRALALVESYADDVGRGVLLSNVGKALTMLGRWGAAHDALVEANAIHHLHGNWPAAARTEARLEDLRRRRDDGFTNADERG